MPVPTTEQFVNYGMEELPAASEFQKLSNPTPRIYMRSLMPVELNPSLSITHISTSFRYNFSKDGGQTFYYLYQDPNSVTTYTPQLVTDNVTQNNTQYEIYTYLKDSIATSFFADATTVVIRIILLVGNPNNAYTVSGLSYVYLTQKFQTGDVQFYNNVAATIKTSSWRNIKKCTILFTPTDNYVVRCLFSNTPSSAGEGNQEWRFYNSATGQWVVNDNISANGNTPAEIYNISQEAWDLILRDEMSVKIYMRNYDPAKSLRINGIDFDYENYHWFQQSNRISLPTPPDELTILEYDPDTNNYLELPIQGIGFDDPDDKNNFYTTPGGIIIRALVLGKLIGNVLSTVYKCELVSTYATDNYEVFLKGRYQGVNGKEFPTYCLLPDAENDDDKTKIELSWTEDFSSPAYPLQATLPAGGSKIFYLRVTPKTTTVGYEVFDIVVNGYQIV